MRLPAWTEEELILTLDLYFEIQRGDKKYSSSVLKEMSEKLRKLGVYPDFKDNDTFRNVNGISRKLGNFSAIDPDYIGKGLSACSNLDRIIFMKFYKKHKKLKEAVTKIEQKYCLCSNTGKKQLPWTEEELILTLALYNTMNYGQMHGRNPRIIALSNILKQLPIYRSDIRPENFRSIASVSLRLSNFRSCDPDCNTKGLLSSGTGLFRRIFNKYHKESKLLSNAVTDIEKKYHISIAHILRDSLDPIDKNIKHRNTKKKDNQYQQHKNKETDTSFYRKVKEYHLNSSRLCSICDTDLNKIYGKLGEDMMEYHCIKKLSANSSVIDDVRIGDYIQVCPTCHKLLDKYYGVIDYDDLKNIARQL
jgi:5-methylcytosine-specific restriction protein A